MIVKLNFTGRERILREEIRVSPKENGGNVVSFGISLDNSRMGLPGDAQLIVEAYHKSEFRRFEWGTVAAPVQPKDTDLSGLGNSANLKLRVKVVNYNSKHGCILGEAEGIPIVETETDKKSILPIYFTDLRNQIWRITYNPENEGEPVLEVRSTLKPFAQGNPEFFFNVYPPAFAQILWHLLSVRKVRAESEENADWENNWIKFAVRISGQNPPAGEEDPGEWIKDVVDTFCGKYGSIWDKYLHVEQGK